MNYLPDIFKCARMKYKIYVIILCTNTNVLEFNAGRRETKACMSSFHSVMMVEEEEEEADAKLSIPLKIIVGI